MHIPQTVVPRPTTRLQPIASTLTELLRLRADRNPDGKAYTFVDEQGEVTSLTFGELDRRARSIAARLQKSTRPGDRVLLVYAAGLDFVEGFLGCSYAGVLAVPATYPKPKRPMPRLSAIATDCAAKVALTTAQTLDTIELARKTPELARLEWLATDRVGSHADDWADPGVSPDDLAFLQYTSGSTSDPKGVMVSHGNLMHNLDVIQYGFDIEPHPDDVRPGTGVFWLPSYHDMGLIGGILEPMYVGGHSILMTPASFLQRPIRWLQMISQHQASISGAPNFAYDLCVRKISAQELEELDLSSLDLAFCGAEPIRPETLEQFAEAFEPAGFREEAFYPCYGLAESTLLVSGGVGPGKPVVRTVDRSALAEHRVVDVDVDTAREEAGAAGEELGEENVARSQRMVACGQPLFDMEVAIVDPATCEPLPADRVGEIWISGPSVAQGYWNCEQETADAFHAQLPGAVDDRRYLRTGDVGFLDHEGRLFVTGRVKDVIIVRGRNLYPQDIELTVEQADEMLQLGGGAAFSMDVNGQEKLVAVHEIDRQYRKCDFTETFSRVRRAVAREHELDIHAIVLIRQASLPRTTSGKVQRSFCRDRYLAGELKVIDEWARPEPVAPAVDERTSSAEPARTSNGRVHTKPEEFAPNGPLSADEIDRLSERIETWLLDWLVERAGVSQDDIARDKPFAEYGLDSLTAVELSQELEDWLHVELTPVIAWNYPTPITMARYLAEQAGGDDNGAGDLADESLDDERNSEYEALLADIENLSDEEVEAALKGI